MFCLGATLLAVPLYLVGRSSSVAAAGLVLFAVPATMAVLVRWWAGGWTGFDRAGCCGPALWCSRSSQAGLAIALAVAGLPVPALVGVLVVTGIGVALVQTPATTGSTRSPAGAAGTGLGLYNLIRFGGSAVGGAWVAVALDFSSFPTLFAVSAAVAALGLAGSFLGPDPQPV